MRRWTALLAVALFTAGCGTTDRPQLIPPATTAPTASPTPAALSPAEAKARYLAIVAAYNKALEELEDAANAGKPWKTVRRLASAVAAANATHARALRDTAWPEAVREPMQALLAETEAAQRYWERAAKAETAEKLAEAIRSAAAHSGAKEATAVRSALGLPPYRES